MRVALNKAILSHKLSPVIHFKRLLSYPVDWYLNGKDVLNDWQMCNAVFAVIYKQIDLILATSIITI